MTQYKKLDNGLVINNDDKAYLEILKYRELKTLSSKVSYLEKQLKIFTDRVAELEKVVHCQDQ